jgi:hypothetical protein
MEAEEKFNLEVKKTIDLVETIHKGQQALF